MKTIKPPVVGKVIRLRQVEPYTGTEYDYAGRPIHYEDHGWPYGSNDVEYEEESVNVVKLPCGHTAADDEIQVGRIVHNGRSLSYEAACPVCGKKFLADSGLPFI